MQVNDKEEALAHQRKVSYMLARAMETKEDVLEQDRGNGVLRSHLCKAEGSLGPVHAWCQKLSSQNSIPSVSRAKIFEYPIKMLRKSHSWPSETMHCKENNPHEQGDETVVITL